MSHELGIFVQKRLTLSSIREEPLGLRGNFDVSGEACSSSSDNTCFLDLILNAHALIAAPATTR
jgi:hypothetical protein